MLDQDTRPRLSGVFSRPGDLLGIVTLSQNLRVGWAQMTLSGYCILGNYGLLYKGA